MVIASCRLRSRQVGGYEDMTTSALRKEVGPKIRLMIMEFRRNTAFTLFVGGQSPPPLPFALLWGGYFPQDYCLTQKIGTPFFFVSGKFPGYIGLFPA